jgi:hypothetical protein
MAIVKVYFCKDLHGTLNYALENRAPDDVVDAHNCIPESASKMFEFMNGMGRTDSPNQCIHVIQSSTTGYWRTVPVSAELRTLLLEVRAQAGNRPHVLPRPRIWQLGLQAQELRKFCMGIGLPSVRFHTLRACFATQLIRNGVPPIQIQKICGWRDLKTMQRYIRLAGIEVDGATEALKLLPEPEIAAKVVNLFKL